MERTTRQFIDRAARGLRAGAVTGWIALALAGHGAAQAPVAEETPGAQALAAAITVEESEHDAARAAAQYRRVAQDATADPEVRARAWLRLGLLLGQLGEADAATAALEAAAGGQGATAARARSLLQDGAGADDYLLKARVDHALELLRSGKGDQGVEELEFLGRRAAPFVGRAALEERVDRVFLGHAVLALVKIGGEEAAAAIGELVASDDAFVRKAVAEHFHGAIQSEHPHVIEAMSALLADPDVEVRRIAFAEANPTRGRAALAVKVLDGVDDADAEVRRLAWLAVASSIDSLAEAGALDRMVRELREAVRVAETPGIFEIAARIANEPAVLALREGQELFLDLAGTSDEAGVRARDRLFGGRWPGTLPADAHVDRVVELARRVAGSTRRDPARSVVRKLTEIVCLSWTRASLAELVELQRLGFDQAQRVAELVETRDLGFVLRNLDAFTGGTAILAWLREQDLDASAVQPIRARALAEIERSAWGAYEIAFDALLKIDDPAAAAAIAELAQPHEVYPHAARRVVEAFARGLKPVDAARRLVGVETSPDSTQTGAWRAAVQTAVFRHAPGRFDVDLVVAGYRRGLFHTTFSNEVPAVGGLRLFAPEVLRDLEISPWPLDRERRAAITAAALATGLDAWHDVSTVLGQLTRMYPTDRYAAGGRSQADADPTVPPLPMGILEAVVASLPRSPQAAVRPADCVHAVRTIIELVPAMGGRGVRRERDAMLRSLLEWLLTTPDDSGRLRSPPRSLLDGMLQAWPGTPLGDELEELVLARLADLHRQHSSDLLHIVVAGDPAKARAVYVPQLETDLAPAAIHGLRRHVEDVALFDGLLDHERSVVRRYAAAAVVDLAPERGAEIAARLLGDPDPYVRRAGAEMAAEVLDKAVAPALIEALRDPDARVRKAAAAALEAVEFYENQVARWQRVLSGAGIDAGSAAEALVQQATRSDDAYVRIAAIRSLGALGKAEVLPVLIRLTQDDDADIAAAAKAAVEQVLAASGGDGR